MNTEHLRYLLLIAERKSINQAAEALQLQRSYLSKVLCGLEKQLGVTLFERVPKGVLPTPEGAYALERIGEALKILDELTTHFAPAEKSYPQYHDQLVFYCPTKMRPRSQMVHVLQRQQELFPNMTLTLLERPHDEVSEALVGKNNQLAMVVRSEQIPYLNWTPPKALQYMRVAQSPLVALAAENNPAAQNYQTISLATLCKQNLVLVDTDGSGNVIFYELLSAHGTPHIKHIVSGNLNLFYELLATGRYFSLGIAMQAAQDGLRQIPLREEAQVEIGLLFDNQVLDNFPARSLLEIVLEQFGLPHTLSR